MNSKIALLLFILLGLFLKSQERKKYDFEKQVRYIFNDSSYVAMEVAVNQYLPEEKYFLKYVENEVIPLKFMLWKTKNDYKNFYNDDIRTFSSYRKAGSMYSESKSPEIFFDLSFLSDILKEDIKNGAMDYYFSSYHNNVNIHFVKNFNGPNKIEYKLKTFSVEKSTVPKKNIFNSKKFSSKSHVFTNEFLNSCEKCDVKKIIYFNKTIISSKNWRENTLRYRFIISDLVEKNNTQDPLLISRKVTIEGDKNEALDYLKKNKLDYQDIFPEKIIEEDFRDLD